MANQQLPLTKRITGKFNEPPRLRCWIDTAIVPDVVKANANFADMPTWIRCHPESNQRVHLAYVTFVGAVCEPEPHLAGPHPCFVVVEQEQGVPIHVGINTAAAMAICGHRDLDALKQVIELCRPFNNGVLAQGHGSTGAWMIL
jgi:hypothetical protein